MSYLSWIILALALIAVVVILIGWWYERATNEVSLVKTGLGGRHVVLDGGTIAIPFFNTVSRVNMQTLRIPVVRSGGQSLITLDKLRIDVGAEFYISVVPERDAIARAVQTLGDRTFNPDQLGSLIEGMLVDALRTIAAQMDMDELHRHRGKFVSEIASTLSTPLARYGLQVDSVSLISFDQTPFSALDENNAFNAEGMRKLAELVASSKKERAQIESDTAVAVRASEMESYRRKLEIELEERRSEIAQTQEIETLLARQLVEVAQRKSEAEESAAHARIAMEQSIEEAGLRRQQAVREQQIKQAYGIEIAEQDHKIALSEKQIEGTKADAETKRAQSHVIEVEEALETQRRLSEADRKKQLSLAAIEQQGESDSLRVKYSSETEKQAAQTQSLIKREAAETLRVTMEAEADGMAATIAAENTRGQALHDLELERTRLKAMPEVLREMVKPAEKIDSIRVNHVSGLTPQSSSGGGSNGEGDTSSPVASVLRSVMDMAVGFPTLRKLGDEISETFDHGTGKNRGKDKDAG